MTRTTVYRGTYRNPKSKTVVDAFQDHDTDGPAVRLSSPAGDSDIEIEAGDPVDVYLTGSSYLPEGDTDSWYRLSLNGEEVQAGRLFTGTPAGVKIDVGHTWLTIPAGTGIEIDILGVPTGVSAEGGDSA